MPYQWLILGISFSFVKDRDIIIDYLHWPSKLEEDGNRILLYNQYYQVFIPNSGR